MTGDAEDAPVLLMTDTAFGEGVDTAIATALMTAQPRLGPARSWSWITCVFLIAHPAVRRQTPPTTAHQLLSRRIDPVRTICIGAGPAGLYFGILTKLRDPDARVTVLERNSEGVTYGWGVTFFEDVLDSLYAGDPVGAAEIQRSAASWGEQAVWRGNEPVAHLDGYGWAIGRHHLLKLLAETAFTYAFQRTDAGWIWFCAYPFNTSTTTFIAECGPSTWEGLGFDRLAPEESRAELERIFVRYLDGRPLLPQIEEQGSSPWLNSTWVTNRSWYHGNVALAGDAARTTHFSIGAGTRLAIDDVLALNRQLQAYGGMPHNVSAALKGYQRERVAPVRVRQREARYSAERVEQVDSYTALDPTRFSYALGTRFIGSPAPAGVRWVKHQATQLSVGRRARGIANAGRRRYRAQQRLGRATNAGLSRYGRL